MLPEVASCPSPFPSGPWDYELHYEDILLYFIQPLEF